MPALLERAGELHAVYPELAVHGYRGRDGEIL